MLRVNDETMALGNEATGSTGTVASEPILYRVAANLRRVLHLPPQQHLDLWKRVLELYNKEAKPIPKIMEDLCHEPFVEDLLHNDVFWGMAGPSLAREYYGRASALLPAVYATAALMSAHSDKLPLQPEVLSLIQQ